jgi:hypothetical protein
VGLESPSDRSSHKPPLTYASRKCWRHIAPRRSRQRRG